MENKKLFVFLHGFGSTKEENSESIKGVIESRDDMFFLSLNAPFESGRSRGGYARYDITSGAREHIIDEKFNHSLNYIEDQIDKELEKYNLDRSDVILCGRSQGAFMAIYLGLTAMEQCYKIISLCGAFKDIPIHKINDPEIIRLEATHDDVLSQSSKDARKKLEDLGCEITHIQDELSDHDHIHRESFTALLENI